MRSQTRRSSRRRIGTLAAFGAVLRARLGLQPVPLYVAYEVTHLCNLACAYCDRHTPAPGEMSRAEILTALDELCALGMRHISLDGGEPLAHREIDTIVGWLVERGVRVVMNSNGVLVPRRLETVRRLAKLKISLDGPEPQHDRVRGAGAHRKAVRAALAAREAGVAVELTCVVGQHNVDALDALLDHVDELGLSIVFQPARSSLFLPRELASTAAVEPGPVGPDGTAEGQPAGAPWQAEADRVVAAFESIAQRKRDGAPVGNRWSSLRHFLRFPTDQAIPCAAGWINVTMDPQGNLHHCGQLARADDAPNVVALGVAEAFARLERHGCGQCWCARVVEENYAWGGRFGAMLPLRG